MKFKFAVAGVLLAGLTSSAFAHDGPIDREPCAARAVPIIVREVIKAVIKHETKDKLDGREKPGPIRGDFGRDFGKDMKGKC